ncbi:MAG: thioredoxin domain-containing protein [Deltaproteobacteria bacterium]|nr:thioredoxin domain-containing protein [Deltaproteobacteria bacterium]
MAAAGGWRWQLVLALLLQACSSPAARPAAVPQAADGGNVSPPPAPSVADPALPGLVAAPALVDELARALRDKGSDYRPRTEHLQPDGAPKYTNRLIREASPYLLQHAHNPVSWYPWGDEAFERARLEGKPVFLSIGYSTCHWCHVMERESFEDEEIARYLNERYVAIKVDREERPDVDDVYMEAVQRLSGHGGWPMTLVLTADRKPFFGGTYFPARDGDRGARMGFLSILKALHRSFTEEPATVLGNAEALTRELERSAAALPTAAVPGPDALGAAAQRFALSYDAVDGGFGGAPKFPRPVTLELLMRYHRRSEDADALAMVEHTLDKMAAGGIYDQVGGGFHRYATDERWLVPHFEKMLYDNAQLTVAYLEAFQASGHDRHAAVAKDILAYVAREMTTPEGTFFSATDADSKTPAGSDEEGWFFTWTRQELESVLGAERARVVAAYYGVTTGGNFEGRNILHTARPAAEVARELKLTEAALRACLDAARPLLLAARARRPAPLMDTKVITSWNGLMISAFAKAAFVLDDADARARAERAARWLLEHQRDDAGRLLRTARAAGGKPAVLDDYAFLIQGLLDLYEASFDVRWLDEALRLQAQLDERFGDPEHGGYFMAARDAEALLVRGRNAYDGAEPSGQAVATLNLMRLFVLTDDAQWRTRAEQSLATVGAALKQGSVGMPKMLSALDFFLDSGPEIVVASAPGDEVRAAELLRVVRRSFLPSRMIALVDGDEGAAGIGARIPHAAGKGPRGNRSTAYVCEEGACALPTSDPAVLQAQLARRQPRP